MTPLIVSYSGIRGIVGDSLTEAVARRYGHAFGRLLQQRYAQPTVLLGRDTRPSGEWLKDAVVSGLAPFGKLVDLGVVPTPTLQLCLRGMGAQGALCVTASHNPAEWNGFKMFLAPENTVLDGGQIKELQASVESYTRVPQPQQLPRIEDWHAAAVAMHVEQVLACLDSRVIAERHFHVALDAGGGAGLEPTRELLARLGCRVTVVSAQRPSEPLPEHLGELRRVVRTCGCDIGFAQDLDADRLALVTEAGDAPGEEMTLVLAIEHLLTRFRDGPCVVVKNVSTTRAVDEVAARYGAKVVETAVGEVNLSRALLAELAAGAHAFGGEGNGGVIYPQLSPGRDSLMGLGLILEHLALSQKPLSVLLASLPRYVARKARVPIADRRGLVALFARVESAFSGGRVSALDGLKMTFSDGAWLLVRASNTEPVVRLVAESQSTAWVDETLERLLQLCAHHGAMRNND